MSDPDQFLKKAKECVVTSEHGEIVKGNFDHGKISADDLFIVWFAKVLGNWKALISTDVIDGLYWEVTYNGAKQETYIDRYDKQTNSVLTDK